MTNRNIMPAKYVTVNFLAAKKQTDDNSDYSTGYPELLYQVKYKYDEVEQSRFYRFAYIKIS